MTGLVTRGLVVATPLVLHGLGSTTLQLGNVVAIPYTNATDPAATDAANTRAAN